jgi:predicted RNase H-like HicB family nuclease
MISQRTTRGDRGVDPEGVRIICHRESDGWWAESPDIERWSAAADTFAEVARLAEEGIAFVLDEEFRDPLP